LKYFVFLIDLIDGSSEEVKVEPESVKRRKTEWHAGLQKMAGDTTLCKEWWVCGLPAFSILARTGCCDKDQNYNYNIYIYVCMYVGMTMTMMIMLLMMMMLTMQEILDYLSLFTDSTESVHGDKATPVHPADMVIEAFKDEEASKLTLSKIESFLQEVHAVHGKNFVSAPWPASFLDFGSILLSFVSSPFSGPWV
jgi:hypothetical protein